MAHYYFLIYILFKQLKIKHKKLTINNSIYHVLLANSRVGPKFMRHSDIIASFRQLN